MARKPVCIHIRTWTFFNLGSRNRSAPANTSHLRYLFIFIIIIIYFFFGKGR